MKTKFYTLEKEERGHGGAQGVGLGTRKQNTLEGKAMQGQPKCEGSVRLGGRKGWKKNQKLNAPRARAGKNAHLL